MAEEVENSNKLSTEVKQQPQLRCKMCMTKRLLTLEEIQESVEIMKKHNMVKDQILELWSTYDGGVCPEGGNHSYEWNDSFKNQVMDDAQKRKNNELEIVRNNNENKELENNYIKIEEDTKAEIEKLMLETEQKVRDLTESRDKKSKEMQDKIQKNQETNLELEKQNPDLEENIVKLSGRDWKGWL